MIRIQDGDAAQSVLGAASERMDGVHRSLGRLLPCAIGARAPPVLEVRDCGKQIPVQGGALWPRPGPTDYHAGGVFCDRVVENTGRSCACLPGQHVDNCSFIRASLFGVE